MTTIFISHSSQDNDWALQLRNVLSENGYQSLFLDFHIEDGLGVGESWEQALYQRLRQCRCVIALVSAEWLSSSWCVAEAILAREKGKPLFLIEAESLGKDPNGPKIPSFLQDRQYLSLALNTKQDAYRRLFDALEREGLKADNFELPGRPYPGLESFQRTDAAIYFGREDEIADIRSLLRRRLSNNSSGFITILGASGSGKSSLLRAGLLPRLEKEIERTTGTKAWVVVPPVSAGRGLEGFALALQHALAAGGIQNDVSDLLARLRSAEALRDICMELLAANNAPEGSVLLVLDQLEEVFRDSNDSSAAELLRLLLQASKLSGPMVTVIATMRSDFLNAFQLFEGAANSYQEYALDPISKTKLDDIIVGPAKRFGLDIENGLAERMKTDTSYSDALPLLAFALSQLFENAKAQSRLTLGAYEEIGGVAGSIDHIAELLLKQNGYSDLPASDPLMKDLRRTFFSLTQFGELGQITRRDAPVDTLPESSRALIKDFIDARLLISTFQNGQPVLRVAHEALFRVWRRLKSWLTEDLQALILRSQVEEAAIRWNGSSAETDPAWSQERIINTVSRISMSGIRTQDVSRPEIVRQFLGPTDFELLEQLPRIEHPLKNAPDGYNYGPRWQTPLSAEARTAVGNRLAIIGDKRRGVGLTTEGLPDIDWVAIEAGQVTIEILENQRDRSSKIKRTLDRNVEQFQIARYPVTQIQYQAFLEECYRDGVWFLPSGFSVRIDAAYLPPRPKAKYANDPVDSVNWYDALMFCHWLSVKLDDDISLPTEEEWLLASTGGDKENTYPWGQNWNVHDEPGRANSYESELGTTTAVGMFPHGSTPSGVMDMAGNVWEWCLNEFEQPERIEIKTGVSRVLKGGSWDTYPTLMKCADRYGYSAANRYVEFGFRLVRRGQS